ncbi:MAG: hypothetical protein ACFFCS_17495 [Candidatus Hodarchaeota archaeon]
MVFKEDIQEAKERMAAWWDHEIIDRPVISYFLPGGSGSVDAILATTVINKDLAENPDNIEKALDVVEEGFSALIFGGENIPSYFPNYGAGIMAAVFGVVPEFRSNTVWFHKETELKDIVSLLEDVKLNANNAWYSRLKRITEIAAKRALKGGYHVGMTDLGGILDILASFLDPVKLIVAMTRNPEIIDTCRAIIMEKYLKVYDELQDIINAHVDGSNTWLNVWCPKRQYTMQCDFSAMLNPKLFKRFVLPDLIEQAEHMDYAMYHLDGPEEIKYLDDILTIPNLTGIQYVPGMKPGMPQDGAEEHMPLYKKIEKAGISNQMFITDRHEIVPHLYKTLDPKRLFVSTFYLTKEIAACYLPEFIGGNGGKLVNNVLKWLKEKGETNISRPMLRDYLSNNDIKVEKTLERTVLREAKKKIKNFGSLDIRGLYKTFFKRDKKDECT